MIKTIYYHKDNDTIFVVHNEKLYARQISNKNRFLPSFKFTSHKGDSVIHIKQAINFTETLNTPFAFKASFIVISNEDLDLLKDLYEH